MTLEVRTARCERDFDSLRDQWECLEAQLSPRTPFSSLLWNQLWWRHLRRHGRFTRDEFFAQIVTEADRLVAVAPMMVTSVPARGVLRARLLQFFGADSGITERRGLVCRADDQSRAIRALSQHLGRSRQTWDWLEWAGLESQAAIADNFAELGGISWGDQLPCYFLELPASWQQFRSTRSRNIKESLRKCYNSLRRDGLSYELRVVSDAAAAPPALERFFDLHRERAQAPGFRPHVDYFTDPRARSFLHEYVSEMATRGQLHLFELCINDDVVASRIAFAFADQLYLYYSGYRPEWGRYSVMTTLVAEAIKWAIERRFAIINLSTGEDVSKLRWKPHKHLWYGAVQTGDGWRRQLTYRLCNGPRMMLRRHRRATAVAG